MIKFVREYKKYNTTIYEVIREKRTDTYFDKVPRTIQGFIDNAKATKQIDKYHGEEIIYDERKEVLA